MLRNLQHVFYSMEQVHATRSATSQTVMNCPKCKAAKKSSESELVFYFQQVKFMIKIVMAL